MVAGTIFKQGDSCVVVWFFPLHRKEGFWSINIHLGLTLNQGISGLC